MDNAVIDAMIAERRSRRADLLDEVARVDAEIAVLLEAQERSEATATVRQAAVDLTAASSMTAKASVKRVRPLKPVWAKVLRFIGKKGHASLDDIMDMSERKGLAINRNTLRSQASIYTEQGWLERVAVGVFRLTPDGAEKCKLNKDEPPDEDTSGGPGGGETKRVSAVSAPVRRELLSTAALPMFAGTGSVAPPSVPSRNPRSRR